MSPKSRGRKKKPSNRPRNQRRERDHLRLVPEFDDTGLPLQPLSFLEQKAAAAQRKRAETADRDAEARRDFAMPYREAVVDGERYTELDPADPEELRLLILGEHPEYQRIVSDPGASELVDGVNPRLHLAMLQIVITRLWEDEPKSTWREAKKYLAAGHSRREVLDALIEPVASDVWSALSPELGVLGAEPRRRPSRTPAPASGGARDRAFQVRVDILGVKPPIWRRLVLPASMRLNELHLALQIAFDWTDSHLHSFTARSRVIGNRHQLDGVEDETAVRLSDVVGVEGDRLDYEYDFGDSWVHRLVVEQVLTDPAHVVRCTGGRQPAPPEDCGGAYGYGAVLVAARDREHPEHVESQLVLAEADAFDVGTVDGQLGRVPVS